MTVKDGTGTGEIDTDKGAVVRTGLEQAYNKVLHVGAGQAYSTISAATTAANAGDLIIVHPGTYTETLLGKNDVTYYLAYGAILDGSTGGDNELFSSGVTRFRVLGHGTLKIPTQSENEEIYNASGSNVDVVIECDTIDGTTLVEAGNVFGCGASSNTLVVRANRFIGAAIGSAALVAATDGRVFLETNEISYSGALTNTTTGTPVVKISAKNITTIQASPIQGSAGTVILYGLVNCVHPTGNGLNAPAGVTVVGEAGAVKVASSVPSLSGTGTVLVSDAFAFDTASATASNIVKTTAGKIDAYLPDAAPAASGGLLTFGTGVGQLNPAGGRIGPDWANVGSPTSAVSLSGTTISTSQQVASVSGSVGSITGVTFPANFGGLTITSGRVNADVTHWLGTGVTVNASGVPKVDVTHVLGDPVCD